MRIIRNTAFAAAVAALGLAAPAIAQPYGGGYGPGWGMMGGGYGPGYMMGGGYGPGWGMGPGYGYGPGMMGAYGPGWGRGDMMGPGYGPGWGMRGGYGAGYGPGRDLNLSVDDVKNNLEQMMRNPNLKVGEVKQQGDDEIVATIVTKDKDALVQKIVINRHTGFFHPEQ